MFEITNQASIEIATLIAIALAFTAGHALADPGFMDTLRDYARKVLLGDSDR